MPPAPVLISPPNGTIGTTQTPTLTWNSVSGALNYKLQISTVPDFAIITDTATLAATSYTIPSGKIGIYITYYWRVRAGNVFGYGPYSDSWWFISLPDNITNTGSEIPGEFKLFQNYPNPFNPETKINFDIPEISNVKISVYDISGKLISVLVNGSFNAGKYSLNFSGSGLKSGAYIYQIIAGKYIEYRRMILLK